MTSIEKYFLSVRKKKYICVGLDTDKNLIPFHLLKEADPIFEFNKIIIENTIDFAGAYKFNLAFYEKEGVKGIESLLKTISFLDENIFTIGDGKRGDIGNTSEMSADAFYNYFKFDSATINPYMGFDSVSPFLKFKSKLNFILSLTSNKSSIDFEKLKIENGMFLFQYIIQKVLNWNENNNCGLVFGATNFDELKENISSFDNLPVLLPGIGKQGGNLEMIVELFYRNNNFNFILNSSRDVIYKDNSKNFGIAAKDELISLNKKINNIIDSL